MPSLLDMPDVVMNLILEKSDFRSIQNLRKSCRDLFHFIDEAKPDSKLTHFEVTVNLNFIYISLIFKNEERFVNVYRKHENGNTMVQYAETLKILENSDFLEVALRDSQFVLDTGNLDLFAVDVAYRELDALEDDPIVSRFFGALRAILESKNHPMKVKNFQITYKHVNQISEFLPFFNPEKLTLIGSESNSETAEDLSEVVELEQWKNLKEFQASNFFISAQVEDLLHFERISIHVKEISMDMILKFKEAFLKFSHMDDFEVCYFEFNIERELMELFGNSSQITLEFKAQWIFRIPGDSEKVVSVGFNSACISFRRIGMEDLNENVVIL